MASLGLNELNSLHWSVFIFGKSTLAGKGKGSALSWWQIITRTNDESVLSKFTDAYV